MELGKKVFVTDAKTKSAYEATVVGLQISESGYELVGIIDFDNDKKFVESAHVHETMDEAEKFIQSKTPAIEKADKLIADCKEAVDALRIDVIGLPEYEYLAKRIIGAK